MTPRWTALVVLLFGVALAACSGDRRTSQTTPTNTQTSASLTTTSATTTRTAGTPRARHRPGQLLVVLGADSDEPQGVIAVVQEGRRTVRRLGRMSAYPAVWSPDGRRIAFVAATNQTPLSSVWVMNADGSGRRQLVPESDGYTRILEWSPDGRRILYEDVVGSYTSVLWSMRADGTDKQRLVRVKDEVSALEAHWSPNGGAIAFSDRGSIYLMHRDGSRIRRLASHGTSPQWSPDGQTIVFIREVARDFGFSSSVYAVAPAGGRPRRLAPPRDSDPSLASVSPDGRWVLVDNYINGLALVPLNGGKPRRLTRDASDYGGDWSTDGQRIAFLHGDDVWVVGPDGRHQQLVAKAPGQAVISQASWRP